MHGHDLDSLVPILQLASAHIRASMESTLLVIINWFQESNSRRFTGLFKRKDDAQIQLRQQVLLDQLKDLITTLEEFRLVERTKLIKPYEKFFDPETKLMIKGADMFASRYDFDLFVNAKLITFQDHYMYALYLWAAWRPLRSAWLMFSR